MKWLDALRIFNKDHPGKWCIPKSGTPEHQTVVDIMNGKHMRRQEKIQGSGMINDWLKKNPLKQPHEKVMSGEPVIHNISFKHQKLSFQHLLQLLEADDEDARKEAKIKNKTRPPRRAREREYI